MFQLGSRYFIVSTIQVNILAFLCLVCYILLCVCVCVIKKNEREGDSAHLIVFVHNVTIFTFDFFVCIDLDLCQTLNVLHQAADYVVHNSRQPGSFLLRPSTRTPGGLALTVR